MGGVDENAQTTEVSPERKKVFAAVFADAIEVVEGEDLPYVVGGSLASMQWGRPTSIGDIDIIISPPDAKRLLGAFDAAGYETDEPEPQWLYKAKKDDITVDLIFQMQGDLFLDDAMVERGQLRDIEGTKARVMPPEDFIVSQAMSAREDTPDYWYNALGVLARSDLDWDYLVERASRSPRRVLSLLVFAESNDLSVPDTAIRSLFLELYGR